MMSTRSDIIEKKKNEKIISGKTQDNVTVLF